jgi:SNF2 family DNA or RNA helicase
MKEIEKIEEVEMLKDQKDVIDELIKIEKYKNELITNQEYNSKVQNFINETVNKYRYKIEVMNYYNKKDGTDDVNGNQYNTLNTLKEMILQYSLAKFGEEFYKKLINKKYA